MRRRGGFSLIELVLVMLLLIFVAVSVFLLTGAGSAAYIRLSDNRRASSDLRIALSYIDVRIKKMDGTGQVTVCPAPFGQGQALLLSQHIESGDYETYLYVDGGRLKELTIERADRLHRKWRLTWPAPLPSGSIRKPAICWPSPCLPAGLTVIRMKRPPVRRRSGFSCEVVPGVLSDEKTEWLHPGRDDRRPGPARGFQCHRGPALCRLADAVDANRPA